MLSSIGGFIMVVAAAFLIWWFAYYNNDKAILSGAFHNLLTSQEGSADMKMTFKPNDTSASVEGFSFEGLSMEMNMVGIGQDAQADLSLTLDVNGVGLKLKGQMYFEMATSTYYYRVDGVSTLIKEIGKNPALLGSSDYLKAMTPEEIADDARIQQIVEEVGSKIDGKWLKLSAIDLIDQFAPQQMSGETFTSYMKCMTDTTNKLVDNKAMRDNLLYEITDSGMLTATRVGKDADGLKYELTANTAKSGTFVTKLMSTDLMKEAQSCITDFMETIGEEAEDLETESEAITDGLMGSDMSLEDADVKIYFWVDRGSRQAQRLEALINIPGNAGGNFNFVMTYDYAKPNKSIAAPTDNIVNFIDLMNDLQQSGLIPEIK